MKIDAQSKSLRQLIKDEYVFLVPDYQRKYSWTESEVEELINDLEVAKKNENQHFFGTIVVSSEKSKSEKVFEIIDGQQRLTTSFILLYSLLTIYTDIKNKYNYNKLNQRIDKLYSMLVFQDDDGEIKSSKLILNEINSEFFNEYIVKCWNESDEEREKIYNQLSKTIRIGQSSEIYKSYQCLLIYLRKKIEESSNIEICIEELKKIQNTILDSFELVVITVENDADAFLIFETLNDRGLDLTTVDLIKNELFKNCSKGATFEKYKNKWLQMLNNFEDIKYVKSFIRHYWISNVDEVSHVNLFKEIRKYLKGSSELSEKLIDELAKQAVFYGALINPNSNNIPNNRLLNILLDMKSLKYDITNPILLSAYNYYNGDYEKIADIALICRNFLLRYITISNGKPSSIEGDIGKISREFNGDISIISEKFKELSKDNDLKEKLDNLSVSYRSYYSYLLLVELEKIKHKNEKWICPGRKDITIEHILPQNIEGTDWMQEFTSEEAELYVNKLGNLTLLGCNGNSKIKNKTFNEKKEFYKKYTDMKITKEVCNYSKWTKNEIQDRQKEMAKDLLNILKLDI